MFVAKKTEAAARLETPNTKKGDNLRNRQKWRKYGNKEEEGAREKNKRETDKTVLHRGVEK